jgi:hypothetical protein
MVIGIGTGIVHTADDKMTIMNTGKAITDETSKEKAAAVHQSLLINLNLVRHQEMDLLVNPVPRNHQEELQQEDFNGMVRRMGSAQVAGGEGTRASSKIDRWIGGRLRKGDGNVRWREPCVRRRNWKVKIVSSFSSLVPSFSSRLTLYFCYLRNSIPFGDSITRAISSSTQCQRRTYKS